MQIIVGKTLLKYVKECPGINQLCWVFGRSRNYVIGVYMIAFGLSWNQAVSLFKKDVSDEKVRNLLNGTN